jgi:BirA family transcriptional regulator, biotin operon repressor / biotin---[acetyl-CoA-carboxylase] ligase
MVTGVRGDRARQALAGTRFADVHWVDETGSTNRDLLDRARAGATAGIVLVADHQTAGRGRLDRSWVAPPGASLLMSVLVRPSLAVSEASVLTSAMAVSATEACGDVSGVTPGIKWPNDLVIAAGPGAAPRKLAGILAESILETDSVAAVVIGIGMNVNWPGDLPPELADIAVALNHLAGADIDREDLLVALITRFDHWYDRAVAGSQGRAETMDRARELSITLGSPVRVELAAGVIEGVAEDLTAAGELVVAVAPTGERRTIVSGDVVHLRSAQ